MDRAATLAQSLDFRPDYAPEEPPADPVSGEAGAEAERQKVQHLAWLLGAAPLAGAERYKYLLLLRFGLINLLGFSLLALALIGRRRCCNWISFHNPVARLSESSIFAGKTRLGESSYWVLKCPLVRFAHHTPGMSFQDTLDEYRP